MDFFNTHACLRQLAASRGTITEYMAYRLAVALVISALVLTAAAQEASDCPPRSEINNGVCRGKDGADCSKRLQSTICYDTEPQYTDEAPTSMSKAAAALLGALGMKDR